MQQHAFSNTIMFINGVEVTGWDEGDDIIAIKRRVDSISDKVGAGGSMMISISSDKSGEFTFKLQQGSTSNNMLSTLMAIQEAGGAAFVPVACTWQDLFRQDLAEGTTGYLKRPSDMTRGGHANMQEWVVVVERLDMLMGYIPDALPV